MRRWRDQARDAPSIVVKNSTGIGIVTGGTTHFVVNANAKPNGKSKKRPRDKVSHVHQPL